MTSHLPGPDVLARLVSGVTEMMFGMSFTLAGPPEHDWQEQPPCRTAVLPIDGARPVTVAIAADPSGARLLGGAMFSVAEADVDNSMIDDALTELANIIAGQIKSAMALDQPLGLPRIIGDGHLVRQAGGWKAATLFSQGRRVVVWVAISESILQAA